jgi:DNA polymerase
MRWTERQRAMLREMGIEVWTAPGASAVVPPQALQGEAAPAAIVPGERPIERPIERPVERDVPASQPAAAAQAAAAPATLAGSAVASMGWAELRDAVASCRACGLCDSRTQTVFGVGHPEAHWMVVGEAPGEQEDLRGEPFVGPAGQLLDAMLRALGVTRSDSPDGPPPAQRAYIANTLKCRPPRNRNPEPDELARCEPFLVRQIELVRPRIILAMGRFAVQALLRTSEPIGKLRGRVHRYQGVPLVVTYHPAYLLRNLPDKAKSWDDLCLAAETVEQAGRDTGAVPGA